VEELDRLKSGDDQYTALLMHNVGDRLVEAASEWLHAKVRRVLWGYAPDEELSPKEMFQGAFQGIRPAVGYPSLGDQRAIFPLARLLGVEQIGIRLTENGAMYPQASVCGVYIASRCAKYF
jgi:5-methyltetrahydrofolate--homocysteine methyltransferase